VISDKKKAYFERISRLLTQFDKGFIVCGDNVGSNQMQKIRGDVRAHSQIVFGKNSLIKKAIRALIPDHPQLEKLLPCLKWNVGFVFTHGNLRTVRDALLANKVPAAAKPGQLAQCDVTICAQNTGLEPGQTAFFQALNIPTRINKGTIEILNDVVLVKKGDKVGTSECALMQKLNVRPFHFGLQVYYCFEGSGSSVYEPDILDITPDFAVKMLQDTITQIAAIGLATGIPNRASLPHLIGHAFKNLLAVSLESGYDMPQAAHIKAVLADPSKFAAAAAHAPAAATASAPASAKSAPAPKPVVVEEPEDMGMGGLFD